ncbi:MAG: ribose 5-phosphate isomerase B [Erysipelotrichaceae bacterium]|nr:ribose 5-phosphate isomerase B [Erysipelotrichaceae bacterium]
MKISLACDHGGYHLKEEVKKHLEALGHEVIDCGTNSLDSCDYPDYAHKAAELVSNNKVERGIVVCTSGEGVCICANKHHNVRCGLLYNEEVAELTRRHNNVNMVALGAKYISKEEALKYIDLFLNTPFDGGRHENRVNKIQID